MRNFLNQGRSHFVKCIIDTVWFLFHVRIHYQSQQLQGALSWFTTGTVHVPIKVLWRPQLAIGESVSVILNAFDLLCNQCRIAWSWGCESFLHMHFIDSLSRNECLYSNAVKVTHCCCWWCVLFLFSAELLECPTTQIQPFHSLEELSTQPVPGTMMRTLAYQASVCNKHGHKFHFRLLLFWSSLQWPPVLIYHVCQHIRTHQQSAWQFLSKELLSTCVGATQHCIWQSMTWPISGGAVSDQQVGTVGWQFLGSWNKIYMLLDDILVLIMKTANKLSGGLSNVW